MIEPTTPGETLQKGFLDNYGISRQHLADHLGWNVKQVDRICNDQSAITASKALALGYAFGVSPKLWTNIQTEINLFNARKSVKIIPPLPCVPISTSSIIETNIDIPRARKFSSPYKYPFFELKIGESFLVRCDNPTDKKSMDKIRSRITSNLNSLKKRRETKITIITRGTHDGIRVWRIE